MKHERVEIELNNEEAFQKLLDNGEVFIEDLEVIAKTILLCYTTGTPIRMDPSTYKVKWLGQNGTRIYRIKICKDA